ncbi:type I-B CRISPR-associated protein Cas7/Cst2/DevR [Geosporobacter ferrireducens]|uniref:Type I-B CRISPR-associated protein Cas7/Cst2/DevR n=1 Tax=Geosporobacter ferrireducens TaxID=1424294 RepID=A0A1D8GIV7_9FIRM|nr:type I-B CRISPR-associated protein Cas7/Cst2/DevR [Geosporobacter ferrireducens]AOT70857.1 type I-B CRISPR-associated protein Cas7/Cst2/DevR [Geosporobacter ferrireducens]MTI53562.1 type I-B CRISPR-associated protein Cas7/Cst2/DevR [Geosporobacter ferrireducens]
MAKGLSMTVIFQAGSLNYGEGIGNISELKKLRRGNGNVYTYASRQCLRYDIARLGHELFSWNLQVVDKSKGTMQFKDEYTIKDSPEMDLFGYMKTKAKGDNEKGGADTRSAAARISHAISVEPYKSDMDFMTSKGLADRIHEQCDPVNVEQHQSYYTYTITIDLDKVGVDGKVILDNSEKQKRVKELLTIVKLLNRNIRGRQETLAPLFVIGGIYDIANPFFQGRIDLETKGDKYSIKIKPIESALETTLFDKSIKEDTIIGMVDDIFANKAEFKKILPNQVLSVEKYFKALEEKLDEIYHQR